MRERVDEQTPHGGDYSEIFYFNDNDELVNKEIATTAIIRECMKDGTLISETHMDLSA